MTLMPGCCDWKVQAEKKAQMDKDFGDMMSDLNNPQAQQPGMNTSVTLEVAKPKGAQVVPATVNNSAVDRTVVVPASLVGKLIGPQGATIKKLATDSGAQINL